VLSIKSKQDKTKSPEVNEVKIKSYSDSSQILSTRNIKKYRGQVLYDALYSWDEYGRRFTPSKGKANRNNSILFFGCSFMYGQGLNNNETFPFYIAEHAASFKAYNYAVIGGGPHYMLAKLLEPNVVSEIQNSRKYVLVYLYIDCHIDRVAGRYPFANSAPYFYLDSDNRLIQNGLFSTTLFWKSYLQKMILKSPLNQYVQNYVNSKSKNEEDIKLISKIIEESRNIFRQKFKSDDFYVVLYPCSNTYIVPYLKKAGIKYLVYNDKIEFSDKQYTIPRDGHPAALANKELAEMVFKDIKCLNE
jgi:hypothetical protein